MKRSSWIICISIIVAVIFNQPTLRVTYPQGGVGASMDPISYSEKLYDGELEVLNITVKNHNLIAEGGSPQFFFRVYVNGITTIDESKQPWSCPAGSIVERSIALSSLEGPSDYTIRVELIWLNKTSPILQDSSTFYVKVVKLFFEDWSQSLDDIRAGKEEPTEIEFGFKNGGNDVMRNVNMRLIEKADLKVEPEVRSMGDIYALESGTTKFSIVDTYGVNAGRKEIKFEVSFLDFRGVQHSSISSFFITVEKKGAYINLLSPKEIEYNSDISIRARLLDSEDNPIIAKEIIFKIGDLDLGSDETDELGYATLNFRSKFEVGDYMLSAYFPGSSIYEEASINIGISVSRAYITLKLEVEENGDVEKPITIEAILLDSLGDPITGETILFFVDGSEIDLKETNEKGISSINFLPEEKGVHVINATYLGNQQYNEIFKVANLDVRGIKTKISLNTPSYSIMGSPFRIEGKLEDIKGRPVSDAELHFTLKSGDILVEDIMVTNDKGIILKDWQLGSGEYEVKATFKGDSKYEPSSAVITGMIIGSVIFVMIGIVGAGVFSVVIALIEIKKGIIAKAVKSLRNRTGIVSAQQISPPPAANHEFSDVTGHMCPTCGFDIPSESQFCDRCGMSLTMTVNEDVDEKVYKYIVSHSGEISTKKAVEHLDISREQLMESIDRLRKTGRLD